MHPSNIKGILHLFCWYFEKEWIYKMLTEVIYKYAGRITLTLGCAFAGSYSLKRFFEAYRRRVLRRAALDLKTRSLAFKESLKLKLEPSTEEVKKKRCYITNLNLKQLHRELQQGSLSPLEVLHAFQEKALLVDEKTNCITEMILEAEEWAVNLEKAPIKGSLYGIPFSVKDNFKIKGYSCTLGLAKNCKDVEDADSMIVEVLKELGAVPFAKTNVPQLLLSLGSSNPVWGTCNNPWNTERTAGGSSSGEAVLLSLKASVLGLGSDFGGSIRFPCHACGVCGLRATQKRIGYKDIKHALKGWRGINSVIGPLTQDIESLVFIWKKILCHELFSKDPTLVPIIFREHIYESRTPLKIGYFSENAFLTPTPGCQRAIEISKGILKKQGYELIPFDVPDVISVLQLLIKCLTTDGGFQLESILKYEEVDEDLKALVNQAVRPSYMTKLMIWLMCLKAPKMAPILKAASMVKTPSDIMKIFAEREDYINGFIDKWQKLKLDAIICPVHALPAPPHGSFRKLGVPFYTLLFNMIDFPCGVVPITTENSDDQSNLEKYPTSTNLKKTIKQLTVGALGLPIGIQCVTLPWQEELCLRVMKELEDGIQTLI